MKVEDISKELRDVMKFEQESFKKIEEFEKSNQNSDLIAYAKMICRNTTQREITEIQEIYLKKIDEQYLELKIIIRHTTNTGHILFQFLKFGGSFLHFSTARGHLSMNLHCVGFSSRLGGMPLMYFGVSPLSRGIDSKQSLCIGMFGIVVDLFRCSKLHHLSSIHYSNYISDFR